MFFPAPALLSTLVASVGIAAVYNSYSTGTGAANAQSAKNPGHYVLEERQGVKRIIKCPRCFLQAGTLPFGIPMPTTPGSNDGRCLYWNDGIPEGSYETCSEPFDGESNACMNLNLTFIMKNAGTDVVNDINSGINSALNITSGVISGINNGIGSAVDTGNAIVNTGSSIGNAFNNFGGFLGRKRRQIRIPLPTAIGAGSIGDIVSGGSGDGIVKNPQPDGSYMFKIWYKGCVRISLLETLTGSNCRLDPELNDIRYFSQQSLLQPLMDFVDKMSSGLQGFAGINNSVDGLCYFQTKDLTKQIWKSLLHYDPNMLQAIGKK